MTPEAAGAPSVGGGAPEEPEHLVVGHVSKPHGTKGELFIWPLTDTPETVFAPGEELLLGDQEGKLGPEPLPVTVASVRPFKKGVLVRLVGYEDRTAVEPFARRYVLVHVERLQPLAEGEVFYHQLLGLEVVTVDGQVVGTVREVYETEPTHLLEVKGAEKSHLIPFAENIVKRMELDEGRLVIKPPPGLLEI